MMTMPWASSSNAQQSNKKPWKKKAVSFSSSAQHNNEPDGSKKEDLRENKEPKISWQMSKAKKLIYDTILSRKGPLVLDEEDEYRFEIQLRNIYLSIPELAEYHYNKFSAWLLSLWKTIREL